MVLCVIQDLERQNETLQESLRKSHQEQRALLDKVNMLQQQLTQVNNTATQQEQSRTVQYNKTIQPSSFTTGCGGGFFFQRTWFSVGG